MSWSSQIPSSGSTRGRGAGMVLLLIGSAWVAAAWWLVTFAPATAPKLTQVAGAVLLFAAVVELFRAFVTPDGRRLHTGLAAASATLSVVALTSSGSPPVGAAALLGLFLLIRGVADIGIGIVTQAGGPSRVLLLAIGAVEALLGVWVAGPFAATPQSLIVTLGGLALLRGVADIVTALGGWQIGSGPGDSMGDAYTAGGADYAARRSAARHRANLADSLRPSSGRAGPRHSDGSDAAGLPGGLSVPVSGGGSEPTASTSWDTSSSTGISARRSGTRRRVGLTTAGVGSQDSAATALAVTGTATLVRVVAEGQRDASGGSPAEPAAGWDSDQRVDASRGTDAERAGVAGSPSRGGDDGSDGRDGSDGGTTRAGRRRRTATGEQTTGRAAGTGTAAPGGAGADAAASRRRSTGLAAVRPGMLVPAGGVLLAAANEVLRNAWPMAGRTPAGPATPSVRPSRSAPAAAPDVSSAAGAPTVAQPAEPGVEQPAKPGVAPATAATAAAGTTATGTTATGTTAPIEPAATAEAPAMHGTDSAMHGTSGIDAAAGVPGTNGVAGMTAAADLTGEARTDPATTDAAAAAADANPSAATRRAATAWTAPRMVAGVPEPDASPERMVEEITESPEDGPGVLLPGLGRTTGSPASGRTTKTRRATESGRRRAR